MELNCLTNSVNIAKDICKKKIAQGDVVVDATMGNGNDTIFLAQLVGDNGKVYAFDVQKIAINNTREKIIDNNIKCDVQLIHDGHENMDKYIKDNIKLIIFNLGYLPNAQHTITTKVNTTIIAVQKSLELLQRNGIVLLVIYPGHKEGKDEEIALKNFAASLSQKEYNVIYLKFINQINNPPQLIAIEKR